MRTFLWQNIQWRSIRWRTIKIVAGILWLALAPWLARAEKDFAPPSPVLVARPVAPLGQSALVPAAGPACSQAMATETAIPEPAMRAYLQSIHELHAGNPAQAEADALRAVTLDEKFADASALAATATLALKNFDTAHAQADAAVQLNPADEKAWVVLATADNYLGDFTAAILALAHVCRQHRNTWQVAYQWARAEAGLGHSREALDWANRAALTAPNVFAPLHLLRASALAANGQPAPAAEELETYLQLSGSLAPERVRLGREVIRLRDLSKGSSNQLQNGPMPEDSSASGYNALAN